MADTRESADDDESVETSSAKAPSDVDPAETEAATSSDDARDTDDASAEPDTESEAEAPKSKGDKDKTTKWRRWRRAAKSAPDDGDGAAKRRRWIRSAIRWAAAVTVVAVLAGAGYEGWLLFQQHQKDVAAAQALDTARKYAVTLTSTDLNAIDQNFTDVLNGATGEFKDRYTKAGSRLRKVMIDNKVATQGSVVDSAVKSATTNKVEVLLFVRQSVTNSASPDPRTELTAVTITMEKVGGRWLASKVWLHEA